MGSLLHLTPELSMTLVRQRMIKDLQVGNLAPHTQATYLLHVSLFAILDEPTEAGAEFDRYPTAPAANPLRVVFIVLDNHK